MTERNYYSDCTKGERSKARSRKIRKESRSLSLTGFEIQDINEDEENFDSIGEPNPNKVKIEVPSSSQKKDVYQDLISKDFIQMLAITVIVVVAFLLAACGGSKSSAPSNLEKAPSTINLFLDSDNDKVADVYDGDPLSNQSSAIGNGSEESPFIINNIYQLQAIAGVDHQGTPLNQSNFTGSFLYGDNRSDQLSKHFRIAQNIPAGDTSSWPQGFIPIGNCGADCQDPTDNIPFSGILDGRGTFINDLFISQRHRNGVSLIGAAMGAQISDLEISGSISGNHHSGGIVGYAEDVELRSLTFNGNILGNNYLGGILGEQKGGKLIEATAKGIISGNNFIGGISGATTSDIMITNNEANVLGNRNIGGIVGEQTQGRIVAARNIAIVRGRINSGGLIGLQTNGSLINSYFSPGMILRDYRNNTEFGLFVGEQTNGYIGASLVRGANDISIASIGEKNGGTVSANYRETQGTVPMEEIPGIDLVNQYQLKRCKLNGTPIDRVSPNLSCLDSNDSPLFPAAFWQELISTALGLIFGWDFGGSYDYPYLTAQDSEGTQLISPVYELCQLGKESPAHSCAWTSRIQDVTNGTILGRVDYNLDDELIQQLPAGIHTPLYELRDDYDGLFGINSRSGAIGIMRNPALGDPGDYELEVIVGVDTSSYVDLSDLFPMSFSRSFTISLSNNPPVFAETAYNFISYGRNIPYTSPRVRADDIDKDELIYTTNDTRFLFDDGLPEILPNSNLSSEQTTFEIRVSDPYGAQARTNITIIIGDDDSDDDGVPDAYDSFVFDPNRNIQGAGTDTDPYLIENIYQLQAIAGVDHTGLPLGYSVPWLFGSDLGEQLNASYKLNKNINATQTRYWNKGAGFLPIGNCGEDNDCQTRADNQEFQGALLTALLRTIVNLHIRRPELAGVGLFGAVDSYSRGYLTLSYANISGGDWTGGIAGVIYNGSFDEISVTDSNINGGDWTGGIAGVIYNGSFDGISVIDSNISGGDWTGGIAGVIHNGSFDGIFVTDSNINGGDWTGGIVGLLDGGKFEFTSASGIVSTDANYSGGLIGYQKGGRMVLSYFTGEIIGKSYVGGIVGSQNSGLIEGARVLPGTKIMGESKVGGLIGAQSGGKLDEGKVTETNINGSELVGGVVGLQSGGEIVSSQSGGDIHVQGLGAGFVANQSGGLINGSYFAGTFGEVNDANIKGFTHNQDGIILASYWDTNTSGLNHPPAGDEIGLTTEQLQGCGLDGEVNQGSSANCTGLFPGSSWGDDYNFGKLINGDRLGKKWYFRFTNRYPETFYIND